LPKKEGRQASLKNNTLTLYVDSKYQNTHLGYVKFQLKTKKLSSIIANQLSSFLYVLAIILPFSILLAMFFANSFTQPIVRLVSFLENINFDEKIKHDISSHTNNEYEKLYDVINSMLEKMNISQEKLKIASVAFQT